MPVPMSRGLMAAAPLMNRQGVAAQALTPRMNIGILPTGGARPRAPARATPDIMRPVAQPVPTTRPAPQPSMATMAQPQLNMVNPFAAFTAPKAQPAVQPLPAQPFNPNPNPTAGQGAGQMPLRNQLATQPQLMPQVQPFDKGQFAQPQLNPEMLPQVQPFDKAQFAQPGFLGQVQPFDISQFEGVDPSQLSPDMYSLFNPMSLKV